MYDIRNMSSKIFAVIVTYYPDYDRLLRIIETLVNSNLNVVIIDNTGASFDSSIFNSYLHQNVFVYRSKRNRGIAAAQNFGIKVSLRNHSDIILFFDQDSIFDQEFITSLLHPLEKIEVCVSTPSIVDPNSGYRYPSIFVNEFGFVKKSYVQPKSLAKVSIAISSGMAIRSSVFQKVGFFDEDYFIDYVDTDFCFKCKSNSIDIYVAPNAIMKHPISDNMTDYKFMRGFQYGGVRIYYQIRNSILFFKKDYIPIMFGIREISSQIIHILFAGILSGKPLSYCTILIKGLKDGIFNVKGKILDNNIVKKYEN